MSLPEFVKDQSGNAAAAAAGNSISSPCVSLLRSFRVAWPPGAAYLAWTANVRTCPAHTKYTLLAFRPSKIPQRSTFSQLCDFWNDKQHQTKPISVLLVAGNFLFACTPRKVVLSSTTVTSRPIVVLATAAVAATRSAILWNFFGTDLKTYTSGEKSYINTPP